MHRLLPFVFVVTLISILPALGQRKMQEIVYLKNGSIIRSIREMEHLDSLIRITTNEGSVFIFGPGDMQKMTRDVSVRHYKDKGYLFGFESGILPGRRYRQSQFGWNTYQGTARTFSFAVVNGYRFNRFAGVGVGVGMDTYQESVITPVFLRGTGYVFRSRISPVYALDAGYGFYSSWLNGRQSNNFFTYRRRGGFMGNAAAGVQVFLGREVAFYLMAGYRLQDSRYQVSSERSESSVEQRVLFRRMSVKMGLSF